MRNPGDAQTRSGCEVRVQIKADKANERGLLTYAAAESAAPRRAAPKIVPRKAKGPGLDPKISSEPSLSRGRIRRFTLRLPASQPALAGTRPVLGSAIVTAARPSPFHPCIAARSATKGTSSLSRLLMRASDLPHLTHQISQVRLVLPPSHRRAR